MRYEPDRTKLSVDNGASGMPPRPGMGGGRGLEGLRERIERAGGTISADPTQDGWRVEIEIVASAADGIEAVERARTERPDIVLMDLRMPRLEGAEATRQILAALPDPAVQQRLVTAVLDQTPPTPAGKPTPVPAPDLPDELTPREVEVLRLIAVGLSNQESPRASRPSRRTPPQRAETAHLAQRSL
jgi:DNA-binding NarL/FixJ family response regulator